MPEQAYHVYSRLIRYHARNKELSRYYVRERTIPRVRHHHEKETPPAPAIVGSMAGAPEEMLAQVPPPSVVLKNCPPVATIATDVRPLTSGDVFWNATPE